MSTETYDGAIGIDLGKWDVLEHRKRGEQAVQQTTTPAPADGQQTSRREVLCGRAALRSLFGDNWLIVKISIGTTYSCVANYEGANVEISMWDSFALR